MKKILFNEIKYLIEFINIIGSYQIFLILILISLLNFELILAPTLIIAFLISTLIAIPLRYYLFKQRPKPIKYSNFIEKIKASSFPSMHSARATILFLISLSMQITILLKVFFFIVLLIQYYLRIQTKKHFTIDVISGIIVGILSFLITQILIK